MQSNINQTDKTILYESSILMDGIQTIFDRSYIIGHDRNLQRSVINTHCDNKLAKWQRK